MESSSVAITPNAEMTELSDDTILQQQLEDEIKDGPSSSSVSNICNNRPQTAPQQASTVDSRFCCNICLEAVVEPVVTQCGHLYCWPCLYRWLEPGMYQDERATLGLTYRYAAINESRRVCPVCKAPCSVPTLVPIYVRSNSEPLNATTRQLSSSVTAHDNARDDIEDDEGHDDQGPATIDETSENGTSWDITSSSSNGLRQRQQSRSNAHTNDVPSRPAATSPRTPSSVPSPSTPPSHHQHQQHHHQQYRHNNPVWITPLSPTAHQASLTHGLLLSFQQATSGSSSPLGASQSAIPPLHRRRNGEEAGTSNAMYGTELEVQPHATEYLSRLLVMLGSFVILCLLIL